MRTIRSAPRPAAVVLATLLGSLPAEARHLAPLGVQELTEKLVAPAFVLPTTSGHPTSLKEFRGSLVLLNFWATWCPPCVAEMPDLEKLYREFKAEGLVIVAVSIDTEGGKAVAPFWEKMGLTFPSLLDPSREVATRYGAWALPTSFLISPEGDVIARIPGPRDWHTDRARAVFKNLLPGKTRREGRQ